MVQERDLRGRISIDCRSYRTHCRVKPLLRACQIELRSRIMHELINNAVILLLAEQSNYYECHYKPSKPPNTILQSVLHHRPRPLPISLRPIINQLVKFPPFLVEIAPGSNHDYPRTEDMTLAHRSQVVVAVDIVDLQADVKAEHSLFHSGKEQAPDNIEKAGFWWQMGIEKELDNFHIPKFVEAQIRVDSVGLSSLKARPVVLEEVLENWRGRK